MWCKGSVFFAYLQIKVYLCAKFKYCSMKQSVKYIVASAWLALLFSGSVLAIAPLPGLNLTEPVRQPAPQGMVQKQRAARAAMSEQAADLVSRGLLIVVEFADLSLAAGNTKQSFDSLANADDYTYNGAMGSCKKYYQDQSNGKYTPHFDVVGPVVLPQPLAFYGTDATSQGDDRYVADFVIDACKGAQAMGVDFSNYDQDHDGYVDLVYILYAGYSQADGAPAESIWPHAWDMESALYFGNTYQTEYYVKYNNQGYITERNLPMLNGKTILRYACSNELMYKNHKRTSIGTLCHEFGHVLGLADLYRTDGVASNEVPGSWALMSNGNYLNNGNTPPNLSVWEKYALGWVEPKMLTANEKVVLPADGATYKMLNRSSVVPAEGAFATDTMFYIENRQMTGWDKYLPGHGMLVWQIVYDATDWYYNEPNNHSTRMKLLAANGSTPYTSNLTGGKRQDVPFPGSWYVTEFEPYTHAYLSNIEEADGVISFDFTNTVYTDVASPVVDTKADGMWHNLLGQPVDIQSYKGVAVSRQGKVLVR